MSNTEQIFNIIRKNKQGWAFSATDFMREFSRAETDLSLSRLTETGDIRRAEIEHIGDRMLEAREDENADA